MDAPLNTTSILAVSLPPSFLSALMVRMGLQSLTVTQHELDHAPRLTIAANGGKTTLEVR